MYSFNKVYKYNFFVCEYCGKKGTNYIEMLEDHFENCLKNPNSYRYILKRTVL